jgi:cytochrome P450
LGAAAVPLLGHVPAFRRDRVGLLQACVEAPGDVVELRIAGPAYLLKRAEDVQHVLVARHEIYPKTIRNIGPRARRIFGDGLMTSTDSEHRRMKVRSQPAFRRDPVARLNDVIQRGVDAMLDRWEQAAEVDLADEMSRLARQTSIGSIFGVESGSRFEALEEGMDARHQAMSRAFAWPVTEPGFLPIAVRPRLRRALRRLDDTVEELTREQRDRPAPDDSLLSMLMDTYAGGRAACDSRQVRDEVLNLLLASHANIARALTYTLAAVARHPDVEARIREEVADVLGERDPMGDDWKALRYTGMVVAESMRLWPPSPLLFRVARRDDVLPTGMRVRAGSKLLLSPYVLQRDPAYYPDPERFDPERFGDDDGGRARPKYAYFPFGGGPRVCIGQTLSTLETTLVIARVAQRVRFELAGEPPAYVCGCVPAGAGARMRVSARARDLTAAV